MSPSQIYTTKLIVNQNYFVLGPTISLTAWVSSLSQQLGCSQCCRYWKIAVLSPPKAKSPFRMTPVATATHGGLHSGLAFLHKGSKICTNRKSATQTSLLKELADGNSEKEFLEKEKQWELNHKKVGTKAQFMTFIKPSVQTKPSYTFWLRLNRISVQLSTLQVQTSKQQARSNNSTHGITRDWLKPLAIPSV